MRVPTDPHRPPRTASPRQTERDRRRLERQRKHLEKEHRRRLRRGYERLLIELATTLRHAHHAMMVGLLPDGDTLPDQIEQTLDEARMRGVEALIDPSDALRRLRQLQRKYPLPSNTTDEPHQRQDTPRQPTRATGELVELDRFRDDAVNDASGSSRIQSWRYHVNVVKAKTVLTPEHKRLGRLLRRITQLPEHAREALSDWLDQARF